jgi:mannosyl-oligosaccharide alpha-1,2-mannosidase
MKTIAVLAPLLTLSFIPPFVVAYPADTEHLRRGQNLERADAVKQAFRHAWTGYMQYAFPNDELHPVSNGFGNSRNRWGASAVDALSTALIMDLPDVVNVVLDHVDRVDYSQTDSQVSLFETTIRYLGGMISAYDLLMGPLSHLAPDVRNIPNKWIC